MDNNPISNNDILGDTTYFYDGNGNLLLRKNDKNDYATITVITEKNRERFNKFSAALSDWQAQSNGGISDDQVTSALRVLRVSYDTKEYFDFYDRHADDVYKGKDDVTGTKDVYIPNDGKGEFHNEWAARTELKNGFVSIIQGSEERGNPFNSSPKFIHSHPASSEGRNFLELQSDGISYRGASSGTGKAPLGYDKTTVKTITNPSEGIFAIVVSSTHVYLYTQGQVVVAVDRKSTPSKNPGEIK